ncbi:MAG: hypothetical protein V2I47_12105 [Bacteroidales bacterium]|nr:hypothetical protein [Bacteroidales bacterium]
MRLLTSGVLLLLAALLTTSCEKQEVTEIKDPANVEYKMPVEPRYQKGKYVFWAAQNIQVGVVFVTEKNHAISVDIIMEDDWVLTESYIHAEQELYDFPLYPTGDPIVEEFDYITTHYPPTNHYSLTLFEDFYGSFDIAVHADVVAGRSQEPAWAEGNRFPGIGWSMYVHYVPDGLNQGN